MNFNRLPPHRGFLALIAGLLLACGGGDGGDSSEGAFIDSAGGTVKSRDGAISLEIPPGALGQPTQIRITDADYADMPAAIRDIADLGRIVRLEPDGLQFAKPATLTMRLDNASRTNDALQLAPPVLLSRDAKQIELLDSQTLAVDLDSGQATISGQISHFSEVWSNLPKEAKLQVRFSGIPSKWTVGPPFKVTITITRGLGAAIIVEDFTYEDKSESPVGLTSDERIVGFGSNDVSEHEIAGGETKTIDYDYECYEAGKGKYVGVLKFVQFDDLLHLFALAVYGQAGVGVSIKKTEYTSRAQRSIDCTGETARQPTAVLTATPAPTPTPPPALAPTATPLPTATPVPATPTQVASIPTTQTINVASTSTLQAYENCPANFIAGNPPIGTVFTGSGVWTADLVSPNLARITTAGGFTGEPPDRGLDITTRTLRALRVDNPTMRRDKAIVFTPDFRSASGTTLLITTIAGAECTMRFQENVTVNGDPWRFR